MEKIFMDDLISQAEILQLLRAALGSKVEVARQEVANRQRDYLVLIIQVHHPEIQVVLKLAGPDAEMASSFDRTAMLYRLVASQTAIPMPEIVAINMSFRESPWRYLITPYIPGKEWAGVRQQMSVDELAEAYRQIGKAVAQLHLIRFPAFGELDRDGSVVGSGAYLEAFNEHARRIIRSDRLRELFLELVDSHRQLFEEISAACLCHEDLHGFNILFQHQHGQWRLATILDFDKAWAGNHEIDLARMQLWRGMTSPEFWDSYQEITPLVPAYDNRSPIYQLLWCFEYARSTTQHIADTRMLCDQLGIEFPGNFE